MKVKISDTDQRNVDSIGALRKRVTTQSQRIRQLIAEARAELDNARESSIDELQSDKVDRQALANMLSELATRLKK